MILKHDDIVNMVCGVPGSVELYEGMMAANSKEPPRIAKATITEKQAHDKRAYFLCSNCGKVEISSGDLYCPMCGWELEFPFEK